MSATKDARNRTTQFGYDANGNLTGINYPNDADVSIAYNNLDKPVTMTDALGTTQFGYDNAARLTSVDGPWQNDTVSYAYDAEGRRSALGVQKPDGTLDQTGYVYDALGRLDQITSSAGTFNYNYVGDTSRITQLLNPNGTHTNYSYTALGELDVLHNVGVNGSNISRYDYNTDARGVRAALQEQIEQDPVKTLQFSYDPSNQLAGEQVTGGKAGEAYTANYEYDASGNRTRYEKTDAQGSTLTRSSNNKLNQTTATRTTAYGVGDTSGLSYDAAGNLAQVSSSSGSSDYQFDDANRLKAMISRNAAGEAQSKTEFVYDGISRLATSKQSIWINGVWQEQSKTHRLYDDMDVVQERDGQGALVALYVRGEDMGGGIGGLLARVFDVGTSFMHYDGRGNVVQLTDASGAVSGKYTYDAFGNTLSQTGGAAGLNPYRFSTKEAVGSLVYYGYRFYSPSLGKWINRDPIQEGGGVNLYEFVSNSPNDLIDPYGLMPPLLAACLVRGFWAALGTAAKEYWDWKVRRCNAFDWTNVFKSFIMGCIGGALLKGLSKVVRGLHYGGEWGKKYGNVADKIYPKTSLVERIAGFLKNLATGAGLGLAYDLFAGGGENCGTATPWNGPLGPFGDPRN